MHQGDSKLINGYTMFFLPLTDSMRVWMEGRGIRFTNHENFKPLFKVIIIVAYSLNKTHYSLNMSMSYCFAFGLNIWFILHSFKTYY